MQAWQLSTNTCRCVLTLCLQPLLLFLRLQQQHQTGSRGAAGSSRQAAAAAAGAWAPWSCVPAQGRDEQQRLVIDPRDASLQDRLRLQLGQPITLHFVAVDYFGCPAALSKPQRQELRRRSLQLQPADGAQGLTLPWVLQSSLCMGCAASCWNTGQKGVPADRCQPHIQPGALHTAGASMLQVKRPASPT